MTDYALKAENITQKFGAFSALKNVSFDLKVGEVHCLAGENGCGKSTLIKVINGVHRPEPGARIGFGSGQSAGHITPSDAKRNGVHVIWQDLAVFPDLTVAENITFDSFVASPLKPVGSRDRKRRVNEIIARLDIDLDPDELVGNLSIAKRQLVAICRVLDADAKIIFMDEPTASLTRKETESLLRIVRRLSAAGISVVFVSHRLAEVLDVCERVTVLRDGNLVGTYPTEGMSQKKLSKLMTGMDVHEEPRGPQTFGETAIEVKGLTRRGEFADVSFAVRRGEILGLTGLMGSGRTEIALTLFGMNKADAGQILLEGKPVSFGSNKDAIAAGIAYVSEDRLNLGLIQNQSIINNTAITVLDDLADPPVFLAPSRLSQLCTSWIARLKTKVSDPRLPVSVLSGGNQQRIVLAKWLATNPKVLILDAPTVGVDVGAKAGIFEIVRDLAATGMSIILISDEASEIHTHADRCLILRNGRIHQQLDPADVDEEKLEELINA
ncbi:sugar ABC transporter ATP-binding protein [Falsirhodobacter sp. alg1]|uniref:sugar ABC transporter ATP-binding protein n=1 Tax=Falsirhodobacter sp. alg1 TaxID=1472418 RepID=UPI0005EE985C|nr:sugar ABC transporter ATP-binding protein [Falsirhodobacter sp. alg1]